MEAATAGQAGSEGAQGTEQGGESGGLDFGPVNEQIQKLSDGLEQRFGSLEERLSGGQPQGQEPGFDPNDPYAVDPSTGLPFQQGQQFGQQFGQQPGQMPGQQQGQMYDEYGQLTPEGAQAQLQQAIQPLVGPMHQQIQQQQQSMQQLQQTITDLRMDRGAERLENAYPELKEPDAAKALIDAARPFAEQFGRPDLVGDDGFLELVHKAQRADRAADGETPAVPGPQLEPAGGASLAGSEPDIAARIKSAGGRNPIWGV